MVLYLESYDFSSPILGRPPTERVNHNTKPQTNISFESEFNSGHIYIKNNG